MLGLPAWHEQQTLLREKQVPTFVTTRLTPSTITMSQLIAGIQLRVVLIVRRRHVPIREDTPAVEPLFDLSTLHKEHGMPEQNVKHVSAKTERKGGAQVMISLQASSINVNPPVQLVEGGCMPAHAIQVWI